MSSERLFEIRDGRVHLSQGGRAAHWKVLQDALAVEGVLVSRATIYRAKSRTGIFIVVFHEVGRGLQRRLHHGYVRLTKAEREHQISTLIQRFGITWSTAKNAKRRGWFEVQNPSGLTQLARRRTRGRGEYLPEELQFY